MTKNITIELSAEEEKSLSEMAERDDKSVEGFVSALVRANVERYVQLARLVEEGREAIRQGRTSTHQEVVARAKERRQELLAARTK